MIALATQVARRELKLPPSDPAQPTAFSFADAAQLGELLTAAGFSSLHHEHLTVTTGFASCQDFAHFQADINSTLREHLSGLGPEARTHFLEVLAAAAAEYADAEGWVRLENRTLLFAGRKAQSLGHRRRRSGVEVRRPGLSPRSPSHPAVRTTRSPTLSSRSSGSLPTREAARQ